MGSMWTVEPEVLRVDLEYAGVPFWLDLKKELTTGETKRVRESAFRSASQVEVGGTTKAEMSVDWDTVHYAKVHIYVADWSLADDAKKRLPLTVDTLRAMRPTVFELIEKAVNEHVNAMEELEKNSQRGGSELRKISA